VASEIDTNINVKKVNVKSTLEQAVRALREVEV
jgi:hypothetical protein